MIDYLGPDLRRKGDFVLVQVDPCPFRYDTDCPHHGKINARDLVMSIPGPVWYAYGVQGKHIQDAWPDGTADDRERLLSGAHGACYDRAMADWEDDE